MGHPLSEAVRERFQRACGYCGVTEITVGGELTLDHYRPRAAGGSDDQDNLVYACVRCNQYKGNFWSDSADLAYGRRVLHPGVDDISEHVITDENAGYLHGLTATGVFHIALLRLNRPQLVARPCEACRNQIAVIPLRERCARRVFACPDVLSGFRRSNPRPGEEIASHPSASLRYAQDARNDETFGH